MSKPLKRWLYRHKDKPYPSRAEKQSLAAGSNMTLTQVSNWFANVRRRLKNTVPCPDGSWSTRIRRYNDYVEGNAELFSVYSDDGESLSDDSDTGKIIFVSLYFSCSRIFGVFFQLVLLMYLFFLQYTKITMSAKHTKSLI